ncbi:MAG: hypothetical protein KBC41_02890 [Candidatus Pacebacteria bacterium]|nr:hypothetical protein [Candidatus Paceibacterota bacterium]MBP9867001.1 hypothetical protein [Candidatus Paceibacterota bacterium]
MPARYCESRDKIHVVIVSPEEGCSSLWDENVFFEVTGQVLTKHIIDTCYIEVDTIDFFEMKKFEIKLIPEFFLFNFWRFCMKKFFFVLLILLSLVSQSLAARYILITRQEAIRMGFTKEVKLQDEAEKINGPQYCFLHETKDGLVDFVMIFGSGSSAHLMGSCVKLPS